MRRPRAYRRHPEIEKGEMRLGRYRCAKAAAVCEVQKREQGVCLRAFAEGRAHRAKAVDCQAGRGQPKRQHQLTRGQREFAAE